MNPKKLVITSLCVIAVCIAASFFVDHPPMPRYPWMPADHPLNVQAAPVPAPTPPSQ